MLFVCTGNTCRSPMAEALFRRMAPEGWEAQSAGLCAAGALSEGAAAALRAAGVPFSPDRPACQLSTEQVMRADAVVCMTADQYTVLLRLGTPPERLHLLGGGIPDPWGGTEADYRACRDAIDAALPALVEAITRAE